MDNDMTNKQYNEIAEQSAPKSPILKNCFFAFLIGGIICTIGQVFINLYKMVYENPVYVSSAVSVTMVFIGALLTGLGIYEKIAKYAGAGTLVPITGFANAVASPALEFKTEGLVLGLAAKMFVIAGPVIVYGTLTSVVVGIITYFIK